MTDNEIIEALERCGFDEDMCLDCPFACACETDTLAVEISKEILDLINRQKAEIDRYKGVIKILENDVKQAKSEAAISMKDSDEIMFKFHIKGFAACISSYHYDSDCPVDITVNAETKTEAIAKAERALEHKIHKSTMRITVEEGGAENDNNRSGCSF